LFGRTIHAFMGFVLEDQADVRKLSGWKIPRHAWPISVQIVFKGPIPTEHRHD
jgi:hypothetical protein